GLAAGVARVTGVEDLQRLLALDQLLLEHVEDGSRPVLGVGGDLDRIAGPLDLGAGALEVVALGDLTGRLAQRVVHLLAVDLAHDVERRVGHDGPPVPIYPWRWCCAILGCAVGHTTAADEHGRLPERPMGADCKSVGVFLRRFEYWTSPWA